MTNPTMVGFFSISMSFLFLVPLQWMACGTSGPAGVHVLRPAPMGPCREPESVTAPLTVAQNAGESGWRLLTASSENAQVRKRYKHAMCVHADLL